MVSFICLSVAALSLLIILPVNDSFISIDLARVEGKLEVEEPEKAYILEKTT